MEWIRLNAHDKAIRGLSALLREKRHLLLREKRKSLVREDGILQRTTLEGGDDAMEKKWQKEMSGLVGKTRRWVMGLRVVNRNLQRDGWRSIRSDGWMRE